MTKTSLAMDPKTQENLYGAVKHVKMKGNLKNVNTVSFVVSHHTLHVVANKEQIKKTGRGYGPAGANRN